MRALITILTTTLLAASTPGERANIEYTQHRWMKSAQHMEHAVEQIKTDATQDLLAKQKYYLAIAGSYYHAHQYSKAAEYFEKLQALQVKLFGNMDLQVGWAMFALADVYQKLGRKDVSNQFYDNALYVFRDINFHRAANGISDPKVLERVRAEVFGIQVEPELTKVHVDGIYPSYDKAPEVTDPVARSIAYFPDTPGRRWVDPAVPSDVILICVHGLSLDHNTYAQLGERLAKHGIITIAFDVRGFGTYRSALGADLIDFDESIDDLRRVVARTRSDHPNRKIFLLGESMGGAIAVQLAAKHPELMDGVVTSVPAGKRYKQFRQSVRTAAHLMWDPHKPYDVGTGVIKQATVHDPALREEWEKDPNTRGRISPEELIRFQQMLDKNIYFAKQVHKLPVLVFQGVDDKLVKPEATYEIFRAIASPDKNLVVVGNAEHLIFEEGRFSPSNVDMLLGWMRAHGAKITH